MIGIALLRWLCALTNHSGPGTDWYMDKTGEFAILDCLRCRTMIIKDLLDGGHTPEEYEAVLDRWVKDWRD